MTVLLSGCSEIVPPRKQSIAANFSIQVKDPAIRRLTDITQSFEIAASGEFNGGYYTIKGTPLKIEDGTTFKFQLSLPIKDPTKINVGAATGMLWTSKPLQAHGAPLPKLTELGDGKVTGQIDLIPTIGVFLFNMLQQQVLGEEDAGNVKTMIKSMDVDQVVLSLRPGASFKAGEEHIHVGPNSKIELRELNVDQALDYTGQCFVDVNFLDGSKHTGDKIDCAFNGGSAHLHFHVNRSNSVMTLALASNDQKITLSDCTFKFGRGKLSSAHSETSVLGLTRFDWAEKEESDKPEMHLSSSMNLEQTLLELRNPKYSVTAQFRGVVPAFFELDRTATARSTNFYTQTKALAESAQIDIIRPSTSILLTLANANVGAISFTKAGDLQFSLDEGTAGLRSVNWRSKRRSFTLTTAPPSTVSITSGMALALSKKDGEFRGTIPLSVKLGKANLAGSLGNLKLNDVSGTILIEVAKEVVLDSDIDFSIVESALLGNNRADVKVRGLTLVSKNGEGYAQLKKCSVVLPDKTLITEIREQLPTEKDFAVHQVIFDARKWRYKNAVINKVTVRKLVLQNARVTSSNQASFTVSGDVEVDGTVDKGGLLAVIDHPTKWESRPWQASAPLTGAGTVEYKFIPSKALAGSQLDYNLAMKLPLPDDINLDWSQVGNGVLAKAERAVIVSHLRKITPFQGTRSIPLKFKGKLPLFANSSPAFKSIKIKELTTKPVPNGTQMDFVAEASL
jgi:hypothetical protein